MKTTCTTFDIAETESLGKEFAKNLKKGDVVALYGELGAGKTAFARGVLSALGASGHVFSPTFAIVNEYQLSHFKAAHFDMYRVENDEDLSLAGFYDYLGSALIIIEWSEKVEWALDETVFRIRIKGSGCLPRNITIERKKDP